MTQVIDSKIETLKNLVLSNLSDDIDSSSVFISDVASDELTVEVSIDKVLKVLKFLRDQDDFQFEQLIDLAGVDYLTYGQDE